MKIHIVNYEGPNAWILGKFARNLHGELLKMGVEATVSQTPDPAADINHHLVFLNFSGQCNKIDTLMVTHVDTEWRFKTLRSHLQKVPMAICMSSDMVRKLSDAGLPKERLCYVNPAHDGVIKPRPLNIGITSRTYADRRKKEDDFLAFCRKIAPADFSFTIMGAGWGEIADELRSLGFSIEYYPEFDYQTYCRIVPLFDYYLYFGHDEGSMGLLDALSAGVKTIVTRQGFHLDAANGITHGISDFNDLAGVFMRIAAERQARIRSVAHWTWERYARKHLEIWQYLLHERDGEFLQKISGNDPDGIRSLQASDRKRNYGQGIRFRIGTCKTSLARRFGKR